MSGLSLETCKLNLKSTALNVLVFAQGSSIRICTIVKWQVILQSGIGNNKRHRTGKKYHTLMRYWARISSVSVVCLGNFPSSGTTAFSFSRQLWRWARLEHQPDTPTVTSQTHGQSPARHTDSHQPDTRDAPNMPFIMFGRSRMFRHTGRTSTEVRPNFGRIFLFYDEWRSSPNLPKWNVAVVYETKWVLTAVLSED